MIGRVDVVIRTAGEENRRGSLVRAIRSVLNQERVVARPLVVLAGHLPQLASELAADSRVSVHHVGRPVSPGLALAIGRSRVEAPYFAFLDDDDELLPYALGARLDLMLSQSDIDVVVTSGYWLSGQVRRAHLPDIARHQGDALNGLLEHCWLASCGGLYREASVPQRFFDDLPDLCEWTCLAFRLALDRPRVHFLDRPTYNVHDTPGSLSKTGAFLQATLRVLADMRAHAQSLPPAVRARIERKYRAALHDAAEHYRQSSELGKAWRFHLRSMRPPYLLRYGAYTRKLLWRRRTSAA